MVITGGCRNGTLSLRFQGELDHHAAREAMSALSERIDAFLPARCVVDLRGLTFMDSSGIALLLRAEKLMGELGGSLSVSGVQEQPLRVLRAAGLEKRIPITE